MRYQMKPGEVQNQSTLKKCTHFSAYMKYHKTPIPNEKNKTWSEKEMKTQMHKVLSEQDAMADNNPVKFSKIPKYTVHRRVKCEW